MGILKTGIDGIAYDYINFDHVTHIMVVPKGCGDSTVLDMPSLAEINASEDDSATHRHFEFEAVVKYSDGTATVISIGPLEECVSVVEHLIKNATGYQWKFNGVDKDGKVI